MRELLFYLDVLLAGAVAGQTSVIVYFYWQVRHELTRLSSESFGTVGEARIEAGLTPTHVVLIGVAHLGLLPLGFHDDVPRQLALAAVLLMSNVALAQILEHKRRQRQRLLCPGSSS